MPAIPTLGQCVLHNGAKTSPADPATVDWFGFSVSVSGDTAMVGTFRNALELTGWVVGRPIVCEAKGGLAIMNPELAYVFEILRTPIIG